MKNVDAFLEEDHQGHLGRSGEELCRYACRSNELTFEERKDYFYGITTVFPMMLLSHYYQWLSDSDVDTYMKEFVPAIEGKYAPQMRAMLEDIYSVPDNEAFWAAVVSSYLATYPYELLRKFSAWVLTEEQQAKTEEFICADRVSMLTALAKRLADCQGDVAACVKTVVYLGGDYPFELLRRFHKAVIGE